MAEHKSPIPSLTGIAGLAALTDAWVVDVWGVIHNGVVAYPAAVAALARFREHGGTVVLVTNAPRPSDAVIAQFARYGVPSSAYDRVISSGDVTRGLIRRWRDRPLYHIGPERDLSIFATTDARLVGADEAAGIVCTGLFDDETETADSYRGCLASLHARSLPMICANPDLVVERGTVLLPCAGALAAAYEAIGGEVHYAGKPHLPIYEAAFAEIDRLRGRPTPPSRMLAIGDGIRTDMAGAHAAGIDAVFIPSAIHVSDRGDTAAIIDLFADKPFRPIAVLRDGLVW